MTPPTDDGTGAAEPVVPPSADPGDRVAIVAPASGAAARYPHVLDRGLETLRERFDLNPVEFPTARRDDDWLADNPSRRARDIEDAFRDPDISAVLATIGGNDQVRVLKHLDAAVLREHPTRFLGTSDNTHLHSLLWQAGIVSYYGGTVMTDLAAAGGVFDYTADGVRRALFAEHVGPIESATEFSDHDRDWNEPDALDEPLEREPNPGWDWRGGAARADGRVWGGCLAVVDTVLAADRTMPSVEALTGGVLLLESSEERPGPAEVRRVLLGLGERGVLGAVDAVLVGRAKARNPFEDPGPEARAEYRETQYDLVADLVAEYNPDAPVVCNVDVGHTHPVVPVPVGGRCVVDPEAKRVAFPGFEG
ncbi:LD-carboxypeptidase [Haloglomus irregulare]|jgi:muramoyltetrapeptide carboxypeptidase LdcA involved in peptidoglycan recycling|uniref:LD-carboxypeptidase n=1 Tax=Haloglomus irregulare TaxID=2234134 RepID=A0A554NG21_9EURY|nr:S66 peptidase family protein [Haloglomus irregulare]TSD16255.1 LD-carboxypeptidase [Haloglomus irregulare]